MNCPNDKLPLLLYDDLPPNEADALNRHVADCANCRDALAALRQVRDALNSTPTPEVVVNLNQILVTAVNQSKRRRKIVWAVSGALAASLLAFAVFNLEVQAGQGQVMVRWGRQPADSLAQTSKVPTLSPALIALEERVRVLQDLTHALARDVDRRDRLRADEETRTQAMLEILTRSTGQGVVEIKRDVDALYAAQFKLTNQGAKP